MLIQKMLPLSRFDEQLLIMEALSERNDPYVADIVVGLFSNNTKIDYHRNEHLLRVLFNLFYTNAKSEEALANFLDINEEAFSILFQNLQTIQNPYLKAVLLRMLPYANGVNKSKVLMHEAQYLKEFSESVGGEMHPDVIEEIHAFIEACRKEGTSELTGICYSIMVTIRDKSVVVKLRDLIRNK